MSFATLPLVTIRAPKERENSNKCHMSSQCSPLGAWKAGKIVKVGWDVYMCVKMRGWLCRRSEYLRHTRLVQLSRIRVVLLSTQRYQRLLRRSAIIMTYRPFKSLLVAQFFSRALRKGQIASPLYKVTLVSFLGKPL